MNPRYECAECGGTPGDVPPCGCGRDREAARRVADEQRFEIRERTISFTSQTLITDDSTAERALRDVLCTTREERDDARRFGPMTRQTMAMHILIKRCAALSKQETTREWRDAPVSEAHDG